MATSDRITPQILDLVFPIVANEIGVQCYKGVTWALINNSRQSEIAQYSEIRSKLTALGFRPQEALRMFKVPNGVVFDFDPIIIKHLVAYLTDGTDKAQLCKSRISKAYEQRKMSEMFRLADLVDEELSKGNSSLLVALFNTTGNPELRINGMIDGNLSQVRLPAFTLRHFDLQECNQDYLIPRGIVIKSIDSIEILPAENGISYRLHCSEQ